MRPRRRASGNTRELQNNINELTAAQEENAAQIAELQAASAEYAEQQAATAQKTQEATRTVDGLISEMNELQEAYNESYNAAMESIDGQLGLFNELDGSAKTSIDNLIGTLQGQVSYMETYAANIQKAMELGVDEGLIKKLSDGSEESAQILAAIVEGGEEDIAALNEQLAKVEKGTNPAVYIPNTAFLIEGVDSDYRQDVSTGPDGTVELRVAPSSYKITERSVPEPYYVSDTPTQTVSLNPGDEKEVRFENQKKPLLTLSKIDADTQEPSPTPF